jgi:hypothetical protein
MLAGFRHQSSKVADSPKTQVVWNGLDSTSLIAPFAQTPRAFHQIAVSNRTSAALYLTKPAFGKTVLTKNPAFDHNSLELYDVTIGVGGAHVGYFFRSPLRLKSDPYYLLFVRRNIDPVEDIIKGPTPAEKRYVLEKHLVIHVHDQGYMITRIEENAVSNMLSTQ